MVSLLGLNILIGVCAYIYDRKLLYNSVWYVTVGSIFLLSTAQIILTELVLGLCGCLSTTNLLYLNGFIFLLVTSLFLYPWFSHKQFQVNSLKRQSILSPLPLKHVFTIILLFLVTHAYVSQFFYFLLNPSMHFDNFTYHFTFPVMWMKSSCLNNPLSVFGDLAPTYSPMNSEMLNYWVMAPISSDIIAGALQHFFLLMAATGLLGLLRELKISLKTSIIISLSFISLPYLITQGIGLGDKVQTTSNDITSLAFFVQSLLWLVRFQKNNTKSNAFYFGIASGIFLGTKVISVLFLTPLLMWFVFLLAACNQPLKRRFSLGTISGLAIILLGSFSYVRNYLITGNPLYPAEIKICGITLFDGIYKLNELKLSVLYYSFSWRKAFKHTGFGTVVLWVLLIAVFCFTVILLRQFRKKYTSKQFQLHFCIYMLLPALLLIFYYIIPFRNIRFLFFPLIIVYLILGLFSQKFPVLWRIMSYLLIMEILISVYQVTKSNIDLIFEVTALCIAVFISGLLIYRCKHWKLLKWGSEVLVILTCLIIIFFRVTETADLTHDYYPPLIFEQKLYGGWNWLRNYTMKSRENESFSIAYTGTNLVYPLFGEGMKNNVYYVPVNNLGTMAHDYPDGIYRNPLNRVAWMNNLIEYDIDLVYCCGKNNDNRVHFTKESHWASALTEYFTLVYSDAYSRIFRFEPAFSIEKNLKYVKTKTLKQVNNLPGIISCPGEINATFYWVIPEYLQNRNLDFIYSFSGLPSIQRKYPSPGRTPVLIHVINPEIPDQIPEDSCTVSVTVSDGEGRLIEFIKIAEIEFVNEGQFPAVRIPDVLEQSNDLYLNADLSLSWTPIPGAVMYMVEVTFPSGESCLIHTIQSNLDVFMDPADYPDLPEGRYSWKVRAIGINGNRSHWSEKHGFICSNFSR